MSEEDWQLLIMSDTLDYDIKHHLPLLPKKSYNKPLNFYGNPRHNFLFENQVLDPMLFQNTKGYLKKTETHGKNRRKGSEKQFC